MEVIQHTLSFASLFPKPQLHCDKSSWVRESVKQTVWYFLIFCLTSWALPSKLLWRPAHKHPFPKIVLWEEAKELKHPQQQVSPGAVIYSDNHTKHFLSDARERKVPGLILCVSADWSISQLLLCTELCSFQTIPGDGDGHPLALRAQGTLGWAHSDSLHR